jgi:hypothetical protein
MRAKQRSRQRRGTVLPLVAICTVAIVGMVALAIDIGMVAIARSQCQNAADSAAAAGARTMNGDPTASYNIGSVPKASFTAAAANNVFNTPVSASMATSTSPTADTYVSGDVTLNFGAYTYVYNDADLSKEGFKLAMPRTDTTEPYAAVKATVKGVSSNGFGRVFGVNSFNAQASAVAVHRPRDIMIIMDLSGSMRFQSCMGIWVSSGGTGDASTSQYPRTKSMNPDPDYPQFGHYSATASAGLYGNTSYSTGAEWIDPCNITYTSISGPPIVDDFYTDGGSTRAWPTRAPASYATTPGGDNFPKNGATWVANVSGLPSTLKPDDLTWERNGYGATFKGYTQGPGHWGKTFFMWPPDPRGTDKDATNTANYADNGAKDWRLRFFFKERMSDNKLFWLDDNNILFNPSGSIATVTTGNANVTPFIKTPQTTTVITEKGINTGTAVTYRYRINYQAIFNWLQTSPVVFPTSMLTGRVQYYSSIPSGTDATLNSRFWSTSTLTNVNERFWRDYVDNMLGLRVTGTSGGYVTYSNTTPNDTSIPLTAHFGPGDLYSWGTMQVTQRPDCNYFGTVNFAAGYAAGTKPSIVLNNVKTASSTQPLATLPTGTYYIRINSGSTIYQVTRSVAASGTATLTATDIALATAVANGAEVEIFTSVPRSMNYADNPYRPRTQFWFGASSFLDWLGNYNYGRLWWPGNVHEAQAWGCKVGIATAIDDIQKNHPNDFIGMTFFSSPSTSSSGGGFHNRAIVPMGRSYQQLKDSLWFPPSTVTGGVAKITPYDSDFNNVPRASGGTAPGMGLMLAYNQFSSSYASLRTYMQPQPAYRGAAGGLGRKGASRTVIFETDGAPNTRGFDTIVPLGSDSYYPVRIKDPTNIAASGNEYPNSGTYDINEVYTVVKQLAALDTASPPGLSTSRKPALVFSLGYGSLFDPSNASGTQANAMTFLQTVQYHGNVAKTTSSTDFPDWQRIYGTPDQRITRIQAAFTKIMQSGVQVSLIQ